MTKQTALWLAALACCASGCSLSARIQRGEGELLRDTVSGGLSEATGIVAVGSDRLKFSTSDCGKPSGTLSSECCVVELVRLPNLIYRGGQPTDKLFTELCDAARPEMERKQAEWARQQWEQQRAQQEYLRSLTPEQRVQRAREIEARAKQDYNQLMQMARPPPEPSRSTTRCYPVGDQVRCDTTSR